MPAFFTDLFERSGHDEAAPSIGDQDVDRPECFFDLMAHLLDLVEPGDVSDDLHGRAPGAFDFNEYGRQGRGIPAVHHHLCALLGKQPES